MGDTYIHVYRHRQGYALQAIDADRWHAFCSGAAPVETDGQSRQLKVLLVTIRDRVCELVEPIAIDVDRNGYIERKELSLPPLHADQVVDLRGRFLRRYLEHAHQWKPDATLIDRALALSAARFPAPQPVES